MKVTLRTDEITLSVNGKHNADWNEQALDLAQRIANGESRKGIVDTANWDSLVIRKDGVARTVFDRRPCGFKDPAPEVSITNYEDTCNFDIVKPIVVLND